MAKFFIELSTGIGPLIRCLPITLWLRQRGHEVRYFARDNSTKYMREFGLEPIDIDPPRVAFNRVLAPDWRDTDEFWGTFGFNQREWLEDRIGIWIAALKAYAPDVVIGDLGVLSSITSRILDIPLAMITQSCFHPRVLGGIQTFWREGAGPRHETRDCVNRLLRAYGKGAREIGRFDEIFCGDRTIIPSIPEFDLLEPGPSYNEVFVGPILWDGVREGSEPSTWPEFGAGLPVVFVYTGRMNDSAGKSGELLLRGVLESAKDNAFNLVISTGGMDDVPADIDFDLPNVRLVHWVPMEVAYARSDLVIHHGGHGSCVGGLLHAVPAVIVPTHNEREYNARLMQKLGCARFVPKREASGARITAAVHELLNDAFAATKLEQHRRSIAKQYSDGIDRAGQAILSLTA